MIRALEYISEDRGVPQEIRVDNGPEFISTKLAFWAKEHHIRLEHIKPGKRAQNGYIERFNRTCREDILDMYDFRNLDEVRHIISEWMYDWNNKRPHRALGGIPPRALCSLSDSLVLTGHKMGSLHINFIFFMFLYRFLIFQSILCSLIIVELILCQVISSPFLRYSQILQLK